MFSTTTLSLSAYLGAIPVDWLVLGAVALFLTVFAMYGGAHQIISLSLAAFFAFSLAPLAPHTLFVSSFVGDTPTTSIQLAILAVLFAGLFVLFRWMIQDVLDATGPIQAILAGIAGTVIVLVIWLQIPTLSSVWDFSSSIETIFGEPYRLWWIVGAFIALTFARG